MKHELKNFELIIEGGEKPDKVLPPIDTLSVAGTLELKFDLSHPGIFDLFPHQRT